MTRERSGFADATEMLHPTKKAAIAADVQALVGNAGVTKQLLEVAGPLAALLAEYIEAEKAAVKVVAIGSGRKGA